MHFNFSGRRPESRFISSGQQNTIVDTSRREVDTSVLFQFWRLLMGWEYMGSTIPLHDSLCLLSLYLIAR